jgi:hypothetical protein
MFRKRTMKVTATFRTTFSVASTPLPTTITITTINHICVPVRVGHSTEELFVVDEV